MPKSNKKENQDNEIIIIGGGYLFKETSSSVNVWSLLGLTVMLKEIFIIQNCMSNWKKISSKSYEKDENNDYNFKIEEY